ncbi:hypothetical protein RUM44_005518 [Polyplax serrata]|uniref:Angiogenic factor with G patch and FHA domains 1 n=1 Tax=Polyplax serrata TaxID=468196 RepID=A0ABR1ADL4_POLSC
MTDVSTQSISETDETTPDLDSDIDCRIKELKHDFHDALADRPDISKYIERLHTIIRRQQKKLNKFYKKLNDHKFVKKCTTECKETQTDGFDQITPSNEGVWNSAVQNAGKSIADEVKEAAENALKHTSFVYEPTSGMYYDYSTGYYYDAELRMYYDGNNGRYLEYDEESKSYKYHLTTSSEANKCSNYNTTNSGKKKIKNWDKYKGRKPKKSKVDEAEEGEITETSLSDSETGSSCGEGEHVSNVQVSGFGCEPCMRIMVEETNVEKLKVGSLFVITCKGGTLGREGDHAVLIPDISVSKHHAKFVFNTETSFYYMTDLGSRNGTWLDGERLSAALQESEMFKINHGAVIQIGTTRLLCHIHMGRDTCSSCEPGLYKQSMSTTFTNNVGTKNYEYREQLQNLKKKFGVDGVSQDVYNVPGYEDRAELRRTAVGSSHSSEKTQSASLLERIPKCNKGFKMLAKMGWSEGQTLGKNESGLSEPMPLQTNSGKHGLGMPPSDHKSVSKTFKKKQDILRKTQNRYKDILGSVINMDGE